MKEVEFIYFLLMGKDNKSEETSLSKEPGCVLRRRDLL